MHIISIKFLMYLPAISGPSLDGFPDDLGNFTHLDGIKMLNASTWEKLSLAIVSHITACSTVIHKTAVFTSDAPIPIPVSVLMLFLVILICIGKVTNTRYQPILFMTSFNCILT